MSVSTISARSVRALATRGHASETAFQGVLVAVTRSVQRAVERVRAAEGAALNLAQQQKVAAVAADLVATQEALKDALNDQGRCLLGEHRSFREKVRDAGSKVRDAVAPKSEAGPSWWFALAEAVEALDDAAMQIQSLAASQPVGAPAACLGREVAAHLGAHREALLAEADRWAV